MQLRNFPNMLLLAAFTLISSEVHAASSCENTYAKVSESIREVPSGDKTFLPPTVVTGPLQKRMEAFAKLYPNHVTFVDDVTFKQNRLSGKKKVLMISLNGLSAAQKKSLLKDYLKFVSDRTLSFPLSENAGHLYTRLGAKTEDFISRVDVSAYRLTSDERLETIIELNAKEFENAQAYVKNARKKLDQTVGGFSYDGAKGPTEGKIDSNKPKVAGQGHNCTSWICTAPIGEQGETLYELSGATMKQEVHTNPGWWTSWLAAGAKKDRVPFVIYWTNEPLNEAKKERMRNSRFQWDFDLH